MISREPCAGECGVVLVDANVWVVFTNADNKNDALHQQ